MANLANELEEVTLIKVTNEDFRTMVCFSIMGIPRYTNVVKIVMNKSVLKRGDLINKLTAMEQQHRVTNERPPKLHTAMQALDNRKGKKKKDTCFNCGKERLLFQTKKNTQRESKQGNRRVNTIRFYDSIRQEPIQ